MSSFLLLVIVCGLSKANIFYPIHYIFFFLAFLICAHPSTPITFIISIVIR